MNRASITVRGRAAALLLIVALLTSACTIENPTQTNSTPVTLPDPAEHTPPSDSSVKPRMVDVVLHCITGGNYELTSVTHSMEIHDDPIRELLVELLNTNSGNSALRIGSAQSQILGIERSGALLTLRLLLDSGFNHSDRDYLLLSASIANTLLGFEGIQAVNILCGNRACPVCTLPVGVISTQLDNVSVSYASFSAEASYDVGISRNAYIYFPDRSGKYLIPELRVLSFSPKELVFELIGAIQQGPLTSSCCIPVIPTSSDIFESTPVIVIHENGERICNIAFSSTFANYSALSGVLPWQIYASIVLTLTSFVPNLDAVRVSIDGVNVTECVINGHRFRFEDGLMRRKDFHPYIGDCANLYFSNESGKLIREQRTLSSAVAASPFGLISTLLDEYGEHSTASPSNISSCDLLGVHVDAGNAIVDLSAHFYASCQMLTAMQERAMIYSIINTLCEQSQISTVSFLVEGMPVESLGELTYLRVPLLPDLGMLD